MNSKGGKAGFPTGWGAAGPLQTGIYMATSYLYLAEL